MPRKHDTSTPPDRRDFLKTAGVAATGALLLPRLEALAAAAPGSAPVASSVVTAGRAVQPFALTQVKLAESVFTQKRDRMLAHGGSGALGRGMARGESRDGNRAESRRPGPAWR